MAYRFSNHLANVKTSPTLAITARASAMRAEGKAVIAMSAGEPDFNTPSHICEAAIRAIHEGHTRYTPVDGYPSLKEAIIEKFQRDNQLSYAPDEILVSNGAKQSVYNLCAALFNPGDEVLIPCPYWVSYPDMVYLTGATPVLIETHQDQQLKITPDQLRDAITPKTRCLVINSPSNPSGQAYSATELKAMADVLLEHPDLIIMSDDIYEPILWNGSFANILSVCPDLKDRTVVINGVSKAYAMTGWRIGYAAGPKAIIQAMKKIQSQSTSGPCAVSQMAAQAALSGDQSCVKDMNAAFKKRHDFMYEALKNIPSVDVLPSDGTFYTFPSFAACMETKGITDDVAFAEQLLVNHGVAIVPGSAFGSPGHARISFANSDEQLRGAMEKITAFCKEN